MLQKKQTNKKIECFEFSVLQVWQISKYHVKNDSIL